MSKTKTKISTDNTELRKALVNLVGEVQSDPKNADLVFSASSKLVEGLVTEVQVRDFNFLSDEPEALGGTDVGPNPVEYVLGALAACQQIVIKAHATVLGINVQEVTVEAEGRLDLQGFLGISESRPGFENVTFISTIKTDETSEDKLKKLEQLAFNNCPVLDIVRNKTAVEGKVKFIG